ncbi:Diaminopimelate epimerase-like protein [Glarea lozoyensis ATCC 20868]|uniref:Diaminopimelate epimerase-like protein n=1 Tax=Glarea lozoyensis (strain ATCC 20868 / MF5171) TaxID=1116229 RepID=S3CT37_GLAL2|nr:Diaminopimelate epimerase-like protein [Glarea lozoyensis ATCC 20868]EPE29592.1 Diaminopimelate epimerase-like protein [Glarea lozoyensis ATCC 20868]
MSSRALATVCHIQLYIHDQTAKTHPEGNPLAIIRVPSTSKLTQNQKQAIAAEFNLSETVFLHLTSDDSNQTTSRTIDIFTPNAELPFAGHPTIGTIFYLLKTGGEGSNSNIDTITTKAGPIPISLFGDNKVRAVIPQTFHRHAKTFTSKFTGDVGHPMCSIVKGMTFIYVQLPDLETLGKVDLQTGNVVGDTYASAETMDEGWKVGLVGTMYYVPVNTPGKGEQRHYRTRMIFTREDPGTGSASCGLAAYLAKEVVGGGEGRESFVFEQGVEMGRRNEITVEVEIKGGEVEGVWLSGEAAVVMEGTVQV